MASVGAAGRDGSNDFSCLKLVDGETATAHWVAKLLLTRREAAFALAVSADGSRGRVPVVEVGSERRHRSCPRMRSRAALRRRLRGATKWEGEG